ncbi:putative ribonuclease H-like domain-containing protein [Tanacetum coccineum]
MQSRFQMSSMGELTFFLGLQVKQNNEGIFISQDKYVAEMLKKFDLVNVKAAITPMETKLPLTKDEEAFDVDVHLYRSMIGSLMYLTASRPDIMYAVCVCSRFQDSPLDLGRVGFSDRMGLWSVSPTCMRVGVVMRAGSRAGLSVTAGGCQFYLVKDYLMAIAKKQTIVATSTTEAEYVAAAHCCGQVLWVQNQLYDLELKRVMQDQLGHGKEKCQVSLANWMQFGCQPQPSAAPTQPPPSLTQPVQPPPTITQSSLTTPQPSSVQPTFTTPPIQPVETTSDIIHSMSLLDPRSSNQPTILTYQSRSYKSSHTLLFDRGKSKKLENKLTEEEEKVKKLRMRGKIYKRKPKSTKTPTKILHFEEPDSAQVNTAQVNTAELNPDSTPSAQVNTGEVNAAEVNTGEAERVQRRKGKEPMTEEDLQAEVQASKTSKELQELADLEEAQRLQAKMDAETQRQIDLDALLARRLVEQEEEAAQEALATEFDYIQARLNADQILAEKLQQEEREQYSIEDRAKFLHDTIAAQRKFLAEQRSAVIRNKPPTISQLRNQMITYLKHVANKKHAELKSKSFEEIQVLYERYKKQDQTFVAIGTEEDERAIKRMNEKATDKEEEKKDESVHEEVKEAEGAKKRKLGTRRKLKAKRRKHTSGLTREDDDLKICLHIAPDEDKVIDVESLDHQYPIVEWQSFFLTTKPQFDQTKPDEDIYLNKVTRSNGHQRFFRTLMGVLSILDREDLKTIYELVMEEYKDRLPEGFDRMLWGDLMIIFNQGDTADFWDTQQDWNLISWKLHSSSGVHTIMTSTGLVFHMLVESRYPLTKEVLTQMLELKLETEEESSMALELIKFVKQQLEEFEDSNDDDLVTSDHGEKERDNTTRAQPRLTVHRSSVTGRLRKTSTADLFFEIIALQSNLSPRSSVYLPTLRTFSKLEILLQAAHFSLSLSTITMFSRVLITAVVVCPCIWLRLNQCDCEDIEKNERNTNEQDKDSDPEYGKEAVVDEYGKEAVCNDGARTDNIPLDSSGCDISETGLNPVREESAVCNDEARTDNIPLDSSGCDISETGLNPVREESAVYNDEARTDDIPLDIRRYNVCKAIAEESALSNVEYCTYNIPLFKRWSDLKDLMDSYERNLN